MQTVEAHVATAHGSRYLQQLAKHWAHKFPVEFTPQDATIDMPLGKLVMSATAERLDVVLSGGDEADMQRFQEVVADHLQRFGFRETLTFAWRAV
jgi:hypothetical protein